MPGQLAGGGHVGDVARNLTAQQAATMLPLFGMRLQTSERWYGCPPSHPPSIFVVTPENTAARCMDATALRRLRVKLFVPRVVVAVIGVLHPADHGRHHMEVRLKA
jgi:hypothetical protein